MAEVVAEVVVEESDELHAATNIPATTMSAALDTVDLFRAHEHGLDDEHLARGERAREPGRGALDVVVAPLEMEVDADPRHRDGQALPHLAVEEGKESRARVDQVHLDAHRGEHARVLAPDHAAADHGERSGQPLDPQDPVGVVDVGIVVRDARRTVRRRSGGHQHHVGVEGARPVGSVHLDRVWVHEPALAAEQTDVVRGEVPWIRSISRSRTVSLRSSSRLIVRSGSTSIVTP